MMRGFEEMSVRLGCPTWAAQVIHPGIAYGCGSDAQVLAAKVLDSYSRDGFLGSLDYAKCFDCLPPPGSHSPVAPACRLSPGIRRTCRAHVVKS